jgi:hypothetical protein
MALIDAKIVSFWRSERERIQRWDEYMCTILDTPILTAFSNNYTRMGDLVSAIEETLNATAGSFLFLEDLNTV